LSQKIKLKEDKEIDLIVTNWQTFKDRIKFFDDIIARLRLEGTPICIGIYTLGYLANFCIIYLLGIIYIFGIFCLDLLHYRLLLIAVKEAIKIEEKFEDEILNVTKSLTSKKRTKYHSISLIILYVVFIGVGIGLIVSDFLIL